MDNINYDCGCEIEWDSRFKAWIVIKFCFNHGKKGEGVFETKYKRKKY